ncbi:Similar to SIS8: Probable serine/threonine-protein kinase SIS8 (Arabidopsis thaliana) [Cotesia congregata]|uniref:Similar to SIS8: Probable serine/threonine-protein kinase SIS8 (Arabidopsis thaliana) n=1 Tax=Cotesia congregata TaxID=51543 RepID=A0A8J2MM63_COTCN|nr:Similar to SIS8: Probable serine/threonine-protein kinase SIS8 (Arabidopsis thaliana) [Cotesia congregata]
MVVGQQLYTSSLIFGYLRDMIQRDRSRQSLPPKLSGLNNDAYRTAFQAFLDRRRNPADPGFINNTPEKGRTDNTSILWKKNYENTAKNIDESEFSSDLVTICEIPYASPSEIFEIGWVAGTEDHNIEVLYAEWHNVKVSLRRHLNGECKNAIKADIKILSEIRHPNIVLLMGTTHTVHHNIAAVCEPIDCTLHHYLHEQFQQIPIQEIVKNTEQLAAALKYVHMRGYVHSAINSHSVFLTSNGVIKLGGWELAVDINKITVDARKYEDCLRAEIFRWQAPELFNRQKPTTATDVYGLALLVWEMATMSEPWADLNKEELEHQYLQLKRGIMTRNSHFPPQLQNLLETGLQLDVNKRTFDMMKMSRYLQRLEMQYENQKPLYVDQSLVNTNTINDYSYLSESSIITSNISPNNLRSISITSNNPQQVIVNLKTPDAQKISVNQLKSPEKISVQQKTPTAISRKNQVHQRTPLIQQKTPLTKQYTPLTHQKTPVIKERNLTSLQQKTPVDKNFSPQQTTPVSKKKLESRKLFENNENVQDQSFNSSSTQSIDCNDNSEVIFTREFQQTPVLPRRPTYKVTIDDSIPEDTIEEPRLDRARLKQVLADRRNSFFTTDISQINNNPFQRYQATRAQIINQGASKDYEPYKPASHKTSIEPKMNSSTEHSILSKVTPRKTPRSPYSCVPPPIRNAVIQPQILNNNSQSFFESSLWSKERSLCASRTKFYDSLEENKNSSPSSNETFTVKNSPEIIMSNKNGNRKLIVNKGGTDVTLNTIPRCGSLQALKDTLDRVTDLVKSSTHINNSSSQSLTSSENFKDFEKFGETPHDALHSPESVFEELYKLNDNVDEEIRPIERSVSAGTFTMEIEKFYSNSDEDLKNQQVVESSEQRPSPTLIEVQTALQCGIPIRTCHEYVEFTRHEKKIESGRLKINDSNSNSDDLKEKNFKSGNDKDNFELFGDHLQKNNEYISYSEITLSRRRSLPPALCQLRNNGSNITKTESPLAKEISKKIDIADGAVEDFYIDDEFSENILAPNMLLSYRNSILGN